VFILAAKGQFLMSGMRNLLILDIKACQKIGDKSNELSATVSDSVALIGFTKNTVNQTQI